MPAISVLIIALLSFALAARADEPAPAAIETPKLPEAPLAPKAPAPPVEPAQPLPPQLPVEAAVAPAQVEAPQLVPLSLLGFTGAAHASYRMIGWAQPGLQLGRRDTGEAIDVLQKRTFLEHRLALGFDLKKGSVELRFEAYVLNGLLHALDGGYVIAPNPVPAGGVAGPDPADPLRNRDWGVTLNSFALRELAIRWRSDVGMLTFGVTTFNFGQGLISNGGGAPIDAELGDQRYGERVARVAFSTKPLQLAMGASAPDLTVALGFDLVLQDQTATLFRPFDQWSAQGAIQDKAYGGIFGLLHKTDDHSLGAFVTRRQIHPPDSPVELSGVTVPVATDIAAWAFDLAGDIKRDLGNSVEIYGAFEGALVVGDTNYVRNDACPGQGSGDRCKLLQGGGMVRGGVKSGVFTFDLLGGFASGDANPFDDGVNNFRIDRDFKVGLILFDQVMGWQSAQMVKRATDPLLTNAPQPGVEQLSTNGSITNALFVQPTLKVQALPSLQLVASVLWAHAPQPVADAYWTVKSGSVTNSFGQPAGQSYGVELDAGVNWRHPLLPGLMLLGGVAGGVFLPGDAFVIDAEGHKMDTVTQLKARAAIQF